MKIQTSSCRDMELWCQRKLREVKAGVVLEHEFFRMLMIKLIYEAAIDEKKRECWRVCIECLEAEMRQRFNRWLHNELSSSDYSPNGTNLLERTRNPTTNEHEYREYLRSMFLDLEHLVAGRVRRKGT